ncbi:serine protease inhibitor Kazal-type 1-like [Gracilinanus agilis]|uniref:serine protease inhibitor Kazal-type 1-like n=1 Tax=Gracilinanus agilis TaxID=191870 RepID=UPI001CFCD793|nr:serine protease inhibitor Kazal-type 1-like [Gracilinanus agilis]XP_044517591.1 serine protease inhibitor Kazal-type 1-like [Gracilinanus agilis]
MRTLSIFLLLSMSLCCFLDTFQADAHEEDNSGPRYACDMSYKPVCGSDGITYPNECELHIKNLERYFPVFIDHNGEC